MHDSCIVALPGLSLPAGCVRWAFHFLRLQSMLTVVTLALAGVLSTGTLAADPSSPPARPAAPSLGKDTTMHISHDPLWALTTPQPGRNRRISSNEQPNWNDGNMDMTRLAPGQEFELPELKGPGYINHIWMTSHAGGVGELNAISLRIYWDGRKEPGVEVPLGDFFACGQSPAVVDSIPVQVSETGSLTCYWRMPFRKSARIVVRNDNPDRGTGLYWQVDWVEVPELPDDVGYFHARYRREYPAVGGRDYEIADIKGRGTYIGTVLSVTMAQDGWFGEGDDFFYIDGEKVPSLQGTGSEDYFNDAWGFRPRTSPWFGQPRWTGWSAGDEGICYRWHVLDPVRFEKSLKLTIEHKGNADESYDAWYLERPDFLSSVAFWYQSDDPDRLFGELPGWHERRVPWTRIPLLTSLDKAEVTGQVKPVPQALGMFGSRPILFWKNTEPGSTLTLPFQVSEEGRYALRLLLYRSYDYGTYSIELDGNALRKAEDLREPNTTHTELLLGTHTLRAGEHRLTFRCLAGKDDRRYLGVESLHLLKLPPEAVREPKGEYERHFIRIGIGSAVACYRLVFGRAPESLEELVRLGMMEERFLKDENMHPIESRREDDKLVVQSTGPDRWTASWTGADARR